MSPTETQRHIRFMRSFTASEQAILAYVGRMVPTRGDADDVMQETSVVLLEKFDTRGSARRRSAIGTFRISRSVAAWMNCCCSVAR